MGLALSVALLLGTMHGAAARDGRIRYVTFNNDDVTSVRAALGISTMVELSPTEVIETVSAGDTKGWSIIPKRGSRFLRSHRNRVGWRHERLVDHPQTRIAVSVRQAAGARCVDQRQRGHQPARLFLAAAGH
ncbi:TrbG/VirB9 family P-type conjugative transfer protein [Mesorhizobium sp. LSHC420B00]|uniref:TrbG/VirB9 family P-type conjugative transfer protein n=1 Tax=Mesorhizobium sp. LSHC420B00 TaxID=1287292 RepID=UPI0018DEBEDE|nr:TrbG/VirB9 family P-type conjugative transfer protein [Mesorhizobium sp. LSHC420B00]